MTRAASHFRTHGLLDEADRGTPSLASAQARLLHRFPRPTPDGRNDILLSPLQLLERLAEHASRGALVPRRTHDHPRLRL